MKLAKGNRVSHFVHPLACSEIGERTRIRAFAHVLPGACIGADTDLCDHVFIENDVILGTRHGQMRRAALRRSSRQDDVFIGPNATFTNDPCSHSTQYPEAFAATTLGRSASIGANATILPSASIGQHARVGAGAVVARPVPARAIVRGNPARITG